MLEYEHGNYSIGCTLKIKAIKLSIVLGSQLRALEARTPKNWIEKLSKFTDLVVMKLPKLSQLQKL